MKTIYLIRHGETLFNVMGLEQGQCDSPLTAKGIEQALQAKKWFNDHHINFDKVYTSTSERAIDTCELITNQPYTKLKGLKEIYLGTKEASLRSSSPAYGYTDYFVQFGGEHIDEVTNRIYNTIDQIAHGQGDTILIVSHGLVMRRFLHKINYPKTDTVKYDNCVIFKILYDNEYHVIEDIHPAY